MRVKIINLITKEVALDKEVIEVDDNDLISFEVKFYDNTNARYNKSFYDYEVVNED